MFPPLALATSYKRKLTPFARSYETDPIAGAGYLSSARDLAKLAIFHLTGRTQSGAAPLGGGELEATHTPAGRGFYRAGWGSIGEGNRMILMSDGQVNGGEAVIMLDPRRGVGVVALTNVANDIVYEVALAAMDEMEPGASTVFNRSAAALARGREGAAEPFYPPKGP